MLINATEIVGVGFPPDEGKKLAARLLSADGTNWDDLEIDVTTLAPSLLISAFFNGFLQTIFDKSAPLLEQARKVRWRLRFDFQKANVEKWMKHFKPNAAA